MNRGTLTACALAVILASACSPEPARVSSDDATPAASDPPARPDAPRALAQDPRDAGADAPPWREDTVAVDAAAPSRDATMTADTTPLDIPPPADAPSPPADAPSPPIDVPSPRDVSSPRDVPSPPPDVPSPRDVTSPPPDVSTWSVMTGVPRIDASLKATLRAVYARGMLLGNRAAVFAKIGDSITESASFLADFGPARGYASWDLGAYGALDPTRVFFNATLVDEHHTSFDRESRCAVAGWSTGRALTEGEELIRQELRDLRPAVAFVMFGSADVEILDVSEVGVFRANLTRIVQMILAAGTIPVLSTIPDRTDTPTAVMQGPTFVAAIREVAAAQRVPLQDYWAALQPLPNRGLSEDGVHPSIFRTPDGNPEAAYFTAPALAYGYNLRNLISLATLAHLRAVVFNDGPPDR